MRGDCGRRWHLWVRGLLIALAVSAAALGAPPAYDHVVIVVEENQSFQQVIGSDRAPYINQLADEGVLFTSMYALTHPSQPNYLHLFSGLNQGVTDSGVPRDLPFETPNLGAALRSNGHSFAGFSQGLPETGSLVAHEGAYVRRHVPWTHWQTEEEPAGPHTLPPDVNRPFTDFPTDAAGFSDLPTLSFVIPDQQNNMHDGPIEVADAWLQTNLSAYRDWAVDHNSLLIVAWDEDNFLGDNRIPLIFSGAHIRPGEIKTRYTLHNLLRTLEEMFALPHAGLAAKTHPLYGAFVGEDPRPATTLRFQQGEADYQGTHDTELPAEGIDFDFPFLPTITVDHDGSSATRKSPSQALIRFDDLVGPRDGQIPPRAEIISAQLVLTTGPGAAGSTSADSVMVHRMLTAWNEDSMWQDFAGGIATDDQQAAREYDFLAEPNVAGAPVIYSVADAVQAWVNGEANHGWVLTTESHNDWIWWSAEAELSEARPLLEVVYRNTFIRGDFNSNGRFDVQDIDLLSQAIRGERQNSIFDLNLDEVVDETDLGIWVREVKQTWFGDANLDGEFNSRDIVQVFQHGEYEDDVAANSTWGEGDWNADHEFNSRDVVAAFQDGGYEAGRRPPPAQPVPEPPGAGWLLMTTFVGAARLRRLPCR